MTTAFAEDHLPDGQKTIQTTNVKRSKVFIQLLTDPERRKTKMGLITGLPGMGKTIAAQDYLDNLAPHAHTALPIAIKIKVKLRSTPLALAKVIMDGLQEKYRGNTIFEIADEAAAAIERNDLKLIIVDEADRLKMAGLEQMRDLYDRGQLGLVLIGMPGLEKRLARYAQLYSRVGFVHQFRTLSTEEMQFILAHKWQQLGLNLTPNDFTDAEAVAAITRITAGNFRLIQRLFAQIDRILQINELRTVTKEVVEAARETLVVGPR